MSVFLRRYVLRHCLILTFLCTSAQAFDFMENKSLSKCCPDGFSLTIFINSENGQKSFDCLPSTPSIEPIYDFISFNVINNIGFNFKDCPEDQLYELELNEHELVLNDNSCVDLINGTYFALSCRQNLGFSMIKDGIRLLKLNKCCPKDQFYNRVSHECVPGNETNSENVLLSEIAGVLTAVVLSPNIPDCNDSESEILVEYHSNRHKIQLSGNKLLIAMEGYSTESISSSLFCMNSASNDHTISDNSSFQWVVKACRPKEICNEIPCIRKCCREGNKLAKKNNVTVCAAHNQMKLTPTFYDIDSDQPELVELSEYGILQGGLYCEKYYLYPADYETDIHYISHRNGKLHVISIDEPYDMDSFCVDFVEMNGKIEILPFICFEPYPYKNQLQFYAVSLTISCVFLAATLLVYSCLPKLLNLHGKTLLCHVISLFAAFSTLASVQYQTLSLSKMCFFIAYFIYFSFLASFSWLNIMCFDIWWTFGTVRMSRGMRKNRELKRFLYYSLYAWGWPLLLTILTCVCDYKDLLPSKFKPNMAESSCWFPRISNSAHTVFFLLPIGIQIFINCILFTLTALHCNKVKNEIHRMQSTDSHDKKKKFLADKAKFIMNIKLFIVMGVSWLLEIVSTLVDNHAKLWLATDLFNALHGVLVFFIFVFKRKVFEALKKRLGIASKKPRGGTTQATGTTTVTAGSGGGGCYDPYSARYSKLHPRSNSSCSTLALSTNNINKIT